MNNTEEIQFVDEDNIVVEKDEFKDHNWKMIIVDDDEAVHSITQLVLRDFTFEGKRLEFINAYSAEEAKTLMDENHDIALMFLDVVMESDDAGLLFVKYVRETLHDNLIRIIIRTGQPGAAPEVEVVQKYDINDYKQKTELTTQKMYTVVISSLRAYQNLQELNEIKNNLEKLVEERSSELVKTNSNLKIEVDERRKAELKAESANQSKSIFLANMSHEIRTPMSAIIGYADLLKRDKKLNADQLNSITIIEKSGSHLLALINDILDISKIEAGRMELKKTDFDLTDLVLDISRMFQARCEEKKLNWQIKGIEDKGLIPVKGDEAKLQQVLINLLGNAVKFTEKGDVILQITNNQNDYFQFEIIDTGEGISTEAINTIFEPFKQDEQGTYKGGTGLGLAICNKHVTLMGGKLQVESVKNKYSRFFFTLKLPKSDLYIKSRSIETQKISHLEDGCNVRAIVVADVELDRYLLTKSLENIGVDVSEAESGFKGIEMTREHKPDIVFVNYRMDEIDGLETIRRIKAEFKEEIKAVIVSASAFDHHLKKFKECGCNGVITKPFRVNNIYNCMADILDIKYKYEEEDEGEDQNQVPGTSSFIIPNVTIPDNLLARLKKSAEFNEITELENLLTELETISPETSKLTLHIRVLAKRYDMESILNVFQKI